MAELAAQLSEGLDALGLALSAEQEVRLLDYLALLQKWRKVYNLTALRRPQEMLTHHLLDSLAVVQPLRDHAAGRPLELLDVGSGAGLPGVVLAIAEPGWKIDCVDTVAKKAAFIQQVSASVGLPNLRGIHQRVENLGGKYDVVTSRALASLNDFVTWSSGSLAEQGVWMAMKGKHPAEELSELPPDVAVFHVEQLEVPGLHAERCLVWLKRTTV